MGEFYDDDEGWDYWDLDGGGRSGGGAQWGGAGSNGGYAGYTPTIDDLWRLPTNPTNWNNYSPSYGGQPVYNTGTTFTATGTGTSSDQGGGIDYYGSRFTPTGKMETGMPPMTGGGGTPSIPPGGNSVSNTQNNTKNSTNVLAQSVGLPAYSPISSGVPQAAASSFKNVDIAQGKMGAPPPMPAPRPPSLHPEKQTGGGKPTSTLGKIAGAAGAMTGIGSMVDKYKGMYDYLKGPKNQTDDEWNAEAYRNTYGL